MVGRSADCRKSGFPFLRRTIHDLVAALVAHQKMLMIPAVEASLWFYPTTAPFSSQPSTLLTIIALPLGTNKKP